MPATTPFLSGGPVVSGAVWPFVCIVIMCGALSGFHALIASGTTPKMLYRGIRHSRDRLRGDGSGRLCGRNGAGGRLHAPTRRLFRDQRGSGHARAAGCLCADGQDAGGSWMGFDPERLARIGAGDGGKTGRSRGWCGHISGRHGERIFQIHQGTDRRTGTIS